MKDLGIYHKYTVYNNRNGFEVNNAFVMLPLKDPKALESLKHYLSQLDENTNLYKDLKEWIARIETSKNTCNRKCSKGQGFTCCAFCNLLDTCEDACDIVVTQAYNDCDKFEGADI